MKSNELMIGDWVMQDDNLQQNRVCQITGIYNNVVVDVTGEKLPLHESHIKPIPLTPEILEKNGFLNDGESWWYLDFRIVLSTSKGVSLVCGHQKRFEFVHQLQHALRLCEIEKEIIL